MPKVLTHKGFKSYDGLLESKKDIKIKFTFKSGKILNCTEDHKLMRKNGSFSLAKNLKLNDILYTKESISKIEYYIDNELVYDLLNVSEIHSYYTNNIISHNCVYLDELAFVPNNIADDFFTSTYPVISSGKTTKLIISSTPKGLNMFYKMWTEAVAGKNGYVPVDVHWTEVPGRDEEWKEKTIAAQGGPRKFAQEFECVSGDTLIELMDDKGNIYNFTIEQAYKLMEFSQ